MDTLAHLDCTILPAIIASTCLGLCAKHFALGAAGACLGKLNLVRCCAGSCKILGFAAGVIAELGSARKSAKGSFDQCCFAVTLLRLCYEQSLRDLKQPLWQTSRTKLIRKMWRDHVFFLSRTIRWFAVIGLSQAHEPLTKSLWLHWPLAFVRKVLADAGLEDVPCALATRRLAAARTCQVLWQPGKLLIFCL